MLSTNKYQKCTNCGNSFFVEQEIFILQEENKITDKSVKEDIRTVWCCAKCGYILKNKVNRR